MDLHSSFNFSLNNRVRGSCVTSSCLEPNSKETLVAVTEANKIILKSTESALHITDQIRCISSAPFGEGYDVLIIGTESQIIAYDFYQNTTLFTRKVPDGINCFVVGNMGSFKDVVLCGGNCAIWGFDSTGKDIYWTVTGDAVTAICLVDYDDDGQMELVVGSEDYEIRIFKNDLMRLELMETDSIAALHSLGGNRFAYALANGTLGVYERDSRLWRIKSKHMIVSIISFPSNDYITCAWNSGKIDIRATLSGEVSTKEFVTGPISKAVLSRIQDDITPEITVVMNDGKVRGFEIGEKKIAVDESQQLLREYGQMKHNLLMELSNYEHEENMSKEEKEVENRIPANTQLETVPRVNYNEKVLELAMSATNQVAIKGVVLFAEGIFEGESHVSSQLFVVENKDATPALIPRTSFHSLIDVINMNSPPLIGRIKGSYLSVNGCSRIPTEVRDNIKIPLVPEKDVSVDVHIKAFLGHPLSRQLHVFEVTRNLPRFSRFGILSETDEYVQPTGFVEFKLIQRVPRMIDWVLDHFLVPEDFPAMDTEAESLILKFVGLAPKLETFLIIKFESAEGQMRIEYDDMETCGSIVQSIAEYFGIETLNSHGVFIEEFTVVGRIIDEMDEMYDVRDRLTTELSGKQSILKEMIVRAEDARNMDDMLLARKYYTRLRHVDRAVRQAFLMKTNNHERLVNSLKKLNKLIELSAKLRVGEPSRKIVALCREAISSDNLSIIPKIMEFGA